MDRKKNYVFHESCAFNIDDIIGSIYSCGKNRIQFSLAPCMRHNPIHLGWAPQNDWRMIDLFIFIYEFIRCIWNEHMWSKHLSKMGTTRNRVDDADVPIQNRRHYNGVWCNTIFSVIMMASSPKTLHFALIITFHGRWSHIRHCILHAFHFGKISSSSLRTIFIIATQCGTCFALLSHQFHTDREYFCRRSMWVVHAVAWMHS